MLSVVGGTLVLGRRFQLLCQSDIGTLPIVYNLFGPNKLFETRKVSKPGEQAIFNCSAIYKRSDANDFLCHAKNSQRRAAQRNTGQLLASTKIIGGLDAGTMTMHSNKSMRTSSNVRLLCRACVTTSVEHAAWHEGRL